MNDHILRTIQAKHFVEFPWCQKISSTKLNSQGADEVCLGHTTYNWGLEALARVTWKNSATNLRFAGANEKTSHNITIITIVGGLK